MKNIVVIGGGIAGIFTALFVKKNFPRHGVHLIEKSPHFGGLLRSFQYPEWGAFDVGIHTLSPTNDAEIDELILGNGFPVGWRELPGDWCGTFWHGRAHHHSPYLDLRALPASQREFYLNEIFETLKKPMVDGSITAKDWLTNHFGEKTAAEILVPVLEKIYRTPATELSSLATKLLPLNRVIGYDVDETLKLMSAAEVRSRIAIPDQKKLPEQFRTPRKNLYPAKIGMHNYVKWLLRNFIQMGGDIHEETGLTSMTFSGDRIAGICMQGPSGERHISNVAEIFWAAGLPAFAFSTLANMPKFHFDKPLHTIIANLVISQKPDMDEAQYMYVYDREFLTFRVANYQNLTNDIELPRGGGYKITLEALVDDSDMKLVDMKSAADAKSNLQQQLQQELRQLNLIKNDADIRFFAVEKLFSGFPKMSLRNLSALKQVREVVQQKKWNNFHFLGAWAEDNLFFQNDILVHAKKQILKGLG